MADGNRISIRRLVDLGCVALFGRLGFSQPRLGIWLRFLPRDLEEICVLRKYEPAVDRRVFVELLFHQLRILGGHEFVFPHKVSPESQEHQLKYGTGALGCKVGDGDTLLGVFVVSDEVPYDNLEGRLLILGRLGQRFGEIEIVPKGGELAVGYPRNEFAITYALLDLAPNELSKVKVQPFISATSVCREPDAKHEVINERKQRRNRIMSEG